MAYSWLTRTSGSRPTDMVLVAAVLGVSICFVILHTLGFNPVAALRDARLGDAPEAGLISNIGIGLMALSGLFAVMRGVQGRSLPVVGIGIGAFGLVFASDATLLMHELLGKSEI